MGEEVAFPMGEVASDLFQGDGGQTLTEAMGLDGPETDSDMLLGGSTSVDDEWPDYCNPEYIMPPMITVRTRVGAEERIVQVYVEKQQERKLYVGGFRHRQTGQVFHHATCQTPTLMKRKFKDTSNLRSRDTQTTEVSSRSQQTWRESGTQMQRQDLHIDEHEDVVKVARPYFSSAQLLELMKIKAVVLQRCWRGYLSRRRVWAMRVTMMEREEVRRREEEAAAVVSEAERREKVRQRMQPKTKGDFAALYNELHRWRSLETTKIKANDDMEVSDKEKLLAGLLEKETRVLQTIERMRSQALKEEKGTKTQRMLELMSAPKKWQMGDGEVAMVHTPATSRARELLDLMNALNTSHLTVDERLDVLLHVKWTVREYPCTLTRDLAELIDREADLLNRGRSPSTLEGLRKRISSLFLQFVQNADFNPAAGEYVRPPAPPAAPIATRNASTSTTAGMPAPPPPGTYGHTTNSTMSMSGTVGDAMNMTGYNGARMTGAGSIGIMAISGPVVTVGAPSTPMR